MVRPGRIPQLGCGNHEKRPSFLHQIPVLTCGRAVSPFGKSQAGIGRHSAPQPCLLVVVVVGSKKESCRAPIKRVQLIPQALMHAGTSSTRSLYNSARRWREQRRTAALGAVSKGLTPHSSTKQWWEQRVNAVDAGNVICLFSKYYFLP